MTTIGYAAMLEQFHPTDLLDWCAAAEATGFEAGFMVSEHFHPVDPAAGPERLRLVVHGRARPADEPALRDGGDVPGVPLPPGRDRARGGDARGDVPGPLLPRPRRRRGAQRARRRRRLAGDRHPQLDDVRVDRDHQQAVHRQGRQAQGRVLHARERPPLHDPRRAGEGLRRDGRPDQRQEGRQVRRRDDHGRGRRREDPDALGEVRRGLRRGRQADRRRRSSSRSTCPGRARTRKPSRTR